MTSLLRRLSPLSRAASAVLALIALCGTGSSLAAQGVDSPASLALDSLLSTPVSTGAKYDQTTRQVAGSVTIITAEDIRRYGYRTLEDALQSMAGVYGSYDRSYAQVGVRGFSRPSDFNNRILLLVDGHTTNESMWGSAMLGEEMALDLRAVDRIEVVRGPVSALYGTGAMFGVINIITRSGSAQQGARFDVGGGSLGRQSASAGGGLDLGAGGAIAMSAMVENRDGRDLYYPEFDSPATNNGIAHKLDYQRRAGGLLSAQRGDLSLRGKYTYRVKGTPTGSYGQTFNDQLAQVRDAAGYLELKYDHDLSAVHHITARTYYDDYSYAGDYPYFGDLTGDRASNRVLGGEAALRWDPLPNNRVTAGAEYRWNARTRLDILEQGVLYSSIDQTFSVVSLYLQDDFQIRHNLSLLLGARHDESSLAGGATTPRVALIYDPRPGTTLKAMYGRAYRAPSLSESASAGPGGNLGPERLTMAELIWMQRLGRNALLTSSLYRYEVDGLIDAVSDTDGVNVYYRNLRQVRSQGLEATLDVRPASLLRGYVNYSIGQALDDDTGSGLTNSPNHLIKVGLASEVTSRVSAATELRYESGRKTLAGTRTDPFLIANLNFGLHPFHATVLANGSPFFHGFDIALRITNLFNTRYAYPGGAQHIQDGIAQDGRGFAIRMGYEF